MEEQDVLLTNVYEDRNIGLDINSKLSGEVIGFKKNVANVRFTTTEDMVIDSKLIHSGFIFSAASYAAIVALNKKNSLVIGADIKFLAPVELGHELIFKASAIQDDVKKCEIKVEGFLLDIKIFHGMFYIAVFDKKLFKLKLEDN